MTLETWPLPVKLGSVVYTLEPASLPIWTPTTGLEVAVAAGPADAGEMAFVDVIVRSKTGAIGLVALAPFAAGTCTRISVAPGALTAGTGVGEA